MKTKEKKVKLTVQEKRLLAFPPTPETWICSSKHGNENSFQAVNSGRSEKCSYCGRKRPEKPDLLWPIYVKACEKVKVEPGTIWKVVDNMPMMRERLGKWKLAPEVNL